MNYDDIQIGQKYMVYEDDIGEVKILGKHVVGGRDVIWYQFGNRHGFGDCEYFSPIPITHSEAVENFNTKLMAFTGNPHTIDELYIFLDEELTQFIDDVDNGRIKWYYT